MALPEPSTSELERQRLEEIDRYEILDSPPEATFDRVIRIVLALFDVDFALITLVDRERCWYKAEVGLGLPEMPRGDNMCDVVLRQDGSDAVVINDAHSALVENVGPLLRKGFRFYIGAPLQTARGVKIGTVCAVGRNPREVTDVERMILSSLAEIVMDELELRLAGRRMEAADEALRHANAQLAAASRNKSDFLASMSHELRTPLNGILGASELLAEGIFGKLNAKQHEYIEDVHQCGAHLLSLINDVLDLSRIEAGQIEMNREPLDVATLMEGCASVVRGIAATRLLQFTVAPPTEPVLVYADPRRIKQIACNLLSNAVKFTPDHGAVHFEAWHEADQIVFLVEDEGPGISPEFSERIFEQFFQLPGDHEGTGLGLPLARQLVELHGGGIWLESAADKGSRFFFSIPRSEPM